MRPEDHIIKQLIEQEIEFEVVQSGYDSSSESAVSQTVQQWSTKFIASRYAPYLDQYLWHIFSYGATPSSEGKKAIEELKGQYGSDTLIFNEPQQYLIRCFAVVPVLEMEDFFDDIYVCHHNMKWTFVIPHEIPDMGPYFSKG